MKQAQIGAVLRAAEQARARGQTTRARVFMHVALALRDQTPTLDEYLRMANVLRTVYEPALEFSVSLRALRCDPNNLRARYYLVSAWTEVGAYERALTLCNAALQRVPQDVSFLEQKGNILRLQQRFEESLTILGVVTSLAPKDAVAWFNVSLVLVQLQRYTDALEAARTAGVLETTSADPLVVQGQAHAALGDNDAAERAFRAALRQERWFLPALAGLRAVYAHQGRIWAARWLRFVAAALGLNAYWRLRGLHRHYRAARLRMEAELAETTSLPSDVYGAVAP